MDNFTLIAIRPLQNCKQRFLKNLQADTAYIFHHAYKFPSDKNEVKEISYTPFKDDDFFSIKRENDDALQIKLSAIVGKNGSGKSTLFELLFLSAYIISNHQNIIDESSEALNEKLSKEQRNGVPDKKKIEQFKKEIDDQAKLFNDFAAELFFRDNDQIKVVRVEHGIPIIKIFNKIESKFVADNSVPMPFKISNSDIGKYFYAIVINYSLYGLNALKSGKWLETLFHKNDGYQTPIVINPFRKNGDILVNSELHLSQSRLMVNLTDRTMTTRPILEGKPIQSITFNLSHDTFGSIEGFDFNNSLAEQNQDGEEDLEDIFSDTYYAFLGECELASLKKCVPHFVLITKYVFKKLLKIAIKYYPEKKFHKITKSGDGVCIGNLANYLDFLVEQDSHVTLKLKQILNCVKYNFLKDDEANNFKWEQDNTITIPIDILESRLKAAITNVDDFDHLELMPAAFFQPSFKLADGSKFHDLSSGEQHLIHTTQAVLYHLINLNTVFNRPDKLYYPNVVLMLDEVELYFHPDFQKRIVSDLMTGIRSLNIPNIKSLNILFSTHSPFILSDIPQSHVLKIDRGFPLPTENQTFGANIHTLLADSFFLTDGFMGIFAQKELSDAIDYMEDEVESRKSGIVNNARSNSRWNETNLGELKELIGEPVLRRAFEELYYTTYTTKIDEQIQRLMQIKAEIKL